MFLMRKRDCPNLFCTGFFEDTGGLFKGGAGGFHIINDDDGLAANHVRIAEGKDILYICAAIARGKFCLSCSGSRADKRVRGDCQRCAARNLLCEKQCLIESPHAFLARVKRDGDENGLLRQRYAVIGHI